MSDTVKLIIEIPKETYKTITADKYAIYDKMYYSIKNGIPLEDVKAEIDKLNPWVYKSEVLGILDNIGKEREEKPNDNT